MFSIILLFAMQSANPAVVEHEQAGIAAQKQGQLDVAISEFQKATGLDPGAATAFFDLGAAYMQRRLYKSDEEIRWYRLGALMSDRGLAALAAAITGPASV